MAAAKHKVILWSQKNNSFSQIVNNNFNTNRLAFSNMRDRPPTNDEAKSFITSQVAEAIMGLHIDATKDQSLQKYPAMQQKLCSVIQLLFHDAVDALLKGEKVAKILRNHNEDTVDLQFPSKHGITTALNVREQAQ